MSHDQAVQITRAWTRRSYNRSTWEHFVVGNSRASSRDRCLVNVLRIDCPPHRRAEVGARTAAALRRRWPELTDSPLAWHSKYWSDAEIAELIAIVGVTATRVLAEQRPTSPTVTAPSTPPIDTVAGPHGFVRWRPFATRSGVPDDEGVYLIGMGADLAGQDADPMAACVIYIGMTERRALRTRLQEFENGAILCAGHSAGWHYRTEVYPDDWASLSAFRRTHVAWKTAPCDADDIEAALRRAYSARWGSLPRLNRV